ncbi:dTDP-4-amino-4,6-dideoxygalactose transaminase [Rhodobium orientis]|uniref:Aminotransferase n=1 Tax=Rhodobium orientis TaxID=34017 RepID=A0A327JUK9_9HYPH|nr:aminotransferase class I/II-fold pyridoxal phosphate-dependent enzyme [Rhodobium orientis]MBB4301033.1 dTDP-4-amino-4,6-dideoxygalactose transaminase [Rhodobium orientis]MBK5949701.1 aminotransferase [Rhodobium orientis]RAI30179.1 aminotransferase [Rhodobium orientis]
MSNTGTPERFEKSFTQQEPIPEAAIARAVEILRSGRLHRYNTAPGEESEAALLERDYAAFQGSDYCLACSSGGQALQIGLRAIGLKPGDKVLANAWTLAPVPGAIHAAGGVPVFVEIDDDWHIDIADLRAKAEASGARVLMLSHMRGHIADMEAVCGTCEEFGITLVEDCAHTMGARWNGTLSGNFGRVAGLSAQTYKHINSGEGGLLTTSDPDVAARAVVLSGSYMLYERHGAIPGKDAFDRVRLETPNLSARMDNLRAALLREQLAGLNDSIARWNARYRVLEDGLRSAPGLRIVERLQHEAFVGSSIQFHASGIGAERIPDFIGKCAARGVDLKWFGAAEPVAFTSRYDSWKYLSDLPDLPNTKRVLSTTCDMRVPLTFSEDDCRHIARIIADVAGEFCG